MLIDSLYFIPCKHVNTLFFHIQAMSDHEAFERSAQEKLVAESGRSKNVEEEKELLRGQVAELRKVCRFFVE